MATILILWVKENEATVGRDRNARVDEWQEFKVKPMPDVWSGWGNVS